MGTINRYFNKLKIPLDRDLQRMLLRWIQAKEIDAVELYRLSQQLEEETDLSFLTEEEMEILLKISEHFFEGKAPKRDIWKL